MGGNTVRLYWLCNSKAKDGEVEMCKSTLGRHSQLDMCSGLGDISLFRNFKACSPETVTVVV